MRDRTELTRYAIRAGLVESQLDQVPVGRERSTGAARADDRDIDSD
jgi:hypothetical protein